MIIPEIGGVLPPETFATDKDRVKLPIRIIPGALHLDPVDGYVKNPAGDVVDISDQFATFIRTSVGWERTS